jgi:hypothetical protein
MAEPRRRRRRAVALGVPALVLALLTIVALWRVGAPRSGEPGSAGTMGLDVDRRASFERITVRQLTSSRTFWAGSLDEEPVFVVVNQPLHLEPGNDVAIEGQVEPAPPVEVARREWNVDEPTARAVLERGVYVRARAVRKR